MHPLTLAEVQRILNQVKFLDWAFKINVLYKSDHEHAYTVQVVFTGLNGTPNQKSRKWYISPWSTEGEIVQTALKAILTAMEHEVREVFQYKGVPVFHPHTDINALIEIADQKMVRA